MDIRLSCVMIATFTLNGDTVDYAVTVGRCSAGSSEEQDNQCISGMGVQDAQPCQNCIDYMFVFHLVDLMCALMQCIVFVSPNSVLFDVPGS